LHIILLDADVIIYLLKIGKFESLLKNHTVYITETIVYEVQYYENELGERIYVDLGDYHRKNKLRVINDASTLAIQQFSEQIAQKRFLPEIHEGEKSCIVLLTLNRDYKFCTGDAAALKVLGYLGLSEQAVSLEELLGRVKNMEPQYLKKTLKKKLEEGEQLRILYDFEEA